MPASKVQPAFSEINTQSDKMRDVFAVAEKAAKTNVCILILGDTGTGKELLSRAIWKLSERSTKPLVVVNCAALPDHLIESELFGYKKGAFTDAKEDKKGRIEEAHEGTLVLDEVAEMTSSAQPKLLRALENNELQRVGDTKTIHVNVRVIACTNKNLEEAVKNKTFREDLYYRLSEVVIQMPPLRERAEDIPLLVQHFINQCNQEFHKNVKGMSEAALALLKRHPFPGNIRELKNIVRRAMVMVEGDSIWIEHLPLEVNIRANAKGELVSFPSLVEIEREHVLKALQRADNNKTKAAQLLGISRQALYDKLAAHHIKA